MIAHAVWLYFRFPLSLRLVEEMLRERGIGVSHETIRCWARKFGPDYAARLRRKPASPKDVWHLDEVVVTIGGKKHWLWRAVDRSGYVLDEILGQVNLTSPLWRAIDAEGYVLDAILQSRRNKKAALRLMRKLLKSQGVVPSVTVTDKLRSYAAAQAELIPGVEHRSHKGLTNPAENSHLPLRRRERRMMRFKSARQCQHFVSVHGQITNLFHLHRKHLTAADHRHLRARAVNTWREIALSTVL